MNMTLSPKHAAFQNSLLAYLPKKQIYTDPLRRLAYGTDASFYRYIPEIVVRAHNEAEVATIMRIAREQTVPITFRASGTSLSGQASSDSVLVLLGDGFLGAEVLEDGAKIKLKPMVIGMHANQLLAPYGRKIGPDPASINTARIGGIAANNSSGMCCGTKENSYHTLESLKVIFADGAVLDTASLDSMTAFKTSHAGFLADLENLAKRIKDNPELTQKIRHKYRLKNTTGYGINALVDFDDPIDMLAHLMIGSEGTLGFISELTYKTVVDHPYKASALIFFLSLDNCCRAVTALRQRATVDAVELLDAKSIRCVGDNITKGLPNFFYSEIDADSACLLIETKAANDAELQEQILFINNLLAEFDYAEHSQFSTDPKTTDFYWSVRKGLLPIVGSNRPVGSNLLTEDVAFPIEHLAEGVRRLNLLFQKHGYYEGMVMGHALEGNLHFVLTPLVDSQAEIDRYDAFMQEIAQMVAVEFQGSLKGEHGTGRNIAPFVQTEWGDDAYQIMCDIKTLFDPLNILNPEVIISSNKKLHLQNLKAMPQADDIVDTCIECGFCEPACPSNGLSLTPRQRIVLWRRQQELTRSGEQPGELAFYKQHYQYQGIDTCAATGMCAIRCPVGINTGDLMKKLKGGASSPNFANFAESHMKLMTSGAKFGLTAAHMVGTKRASAWSAKIKSKFKTFPLVPENLPKAAERITLQNAKIGTPVVYFVSCVNRTVAEGSTSTKSLATHTLNLFKKAGFYAIFPDNMDALCCGQPFESVGAKSTADRASVSLNHALRKASNNGEYPIYLDNAPCALRVKEAQKQGLLDQHLKLFDATTFLAEEITPKLNFTNKLPELAVHVPCSATKMGVGKTLIELANSCANKVSTPDIACCGYAGNKGVITPELHANGLRNLKQMLPSDCQHGVSMSRTCQIGLTTHSGIEYQSIEALLDQCSG